MQPPQDSAGCFEPPSIHNESNGKIKTILSHIVNALLVSSFWLYYTSAAGQRPLLSFPSLVKYNSTLVPNANYYHCGSTHEEARARNCEYDMLNNHWVPTTCMDRAAIVDYQSDNTWQGFADANHTEPLTVQQMGDVDMYWTNERDHIVHCAALWRKQFRALFEGRSHLDSLVVDEEHVTHCSEYLIKMTESGTNFRAVPLKVFIGFAGCHVKE